MENPDKQEVINNEKFIVSPEIVEEAKSRILTGEQYLESEFMKNYSRSYSFKLEKAGNELFFFGTAHIYKPEDELFDEMKAVFEDFEPDMVYIEGMPKSNMTLLESDSTDMSEIEARKLGEPSYIAKLVFDNRKHRDIGLESPEPDRDVEVRKLEELGFTKEEIFKYYFMRLVDQFFRQQNGIKDGISMHKFMKYIKPSDDYWTQAAKRLGWESGEFEQLINNEISNLNLADRSMYKKAVDPIPREGSTWGRTNEVAAQSGRIRDEHILERLAKGLEQHNKLFVVYGREHAVVDEPALRYMFENMSDN